MCSVCERSPGSCRLKTGLCQYVGVVPTSQHKEGGEGESGGVIGHNELLVASLGCVRGRRSALFLAYRCDISRKRIGGSVCE